MKVFLDTEFSTFDDRYCELISFGLVDETGERELYAEIEGWNAANATEFVREVVRPLLGKMPGACCSRLEAKRRLEEWLFSFDEPVTIVIDSRRDVRLLCALVGRGLPNVATTVLLTDYKLVSSEFWLAFYFSTNPDRPRHHALEDARALRQAYQSTAPDLGGEVIFEGTSV